MRVAFAMTVLALGLSAGCGWVGGDLAEVTDPAAIPRVDADAYIYEWGTSDDPDLLAAESHAVVVGTMTGRSRPVDSDDAPLVTLIQGFRVDEVLAGAGVAPGGHYAFFIDLVVEDGELSQFDNSPIPETGAQHLMFVRVSDDESRAGFVVSVGLGSGRIPIDTARERGLVDAGRWDGFVMKTDITATSVDDVPTLDDWRAAVGR